VALVVLAIERMLRLKGTAPAMTWHRPNGRSSDHGPARYFAYSFTLDPAFRTAFSIQHALKAPELNQGVAAELHGHALTYRAYQAHWNGRIAGFEAAAESVFGCLFELNADDQRWVLAAEQSVGAVAQEVIVTASGRQQTATAFVPKVGPNDSQQLVSESFVAHVLEGLLAINAPSPYLDKLFAEAAVLESVQRFERNEARR
jgi:hypothetical protein